MKLAAFERSLQGTGASRRLRNSGRTPAIVYGGSADIQKVELDHNNLWHALKKEVFHSSILEMEVNGQTTQVVLRDVQYHPFKQLVLHVDFQRVDATTKLHLKVPVHYTGADESAAVKTDGCTITTILNELDVTCMPSELPESITVDLSGLKKGTAVHLNDVKFPRGVTPVKRGSNKNPALIAVIAPLVIVEAVAEVAPVAKGQGQGKE